MIIKKNLFRVFIFISSFSFSTVSILRSCSIESFNKNLFFSCESSNEFQPLYDYVLKNSNSITEYDFLRIMILVCNIVEYELKHGNLFMYVSGESIKIHDYNKRVTVKTIRFPSSLNTTEYTPVFWILKTMEHFLGLAPFPKTFFENPESKYKYIRTYGIFKYFKDFTNLKKLLCDIDCTPKSPINGRFVPPMWRFGDKKWKPISISDLRDALINLLIYG